MANYYMGNWHGHHFIIENEKAEKMIVDNEVPIAALPPKHKSTVCMVDIAI